MAGVVNRDLRPLGNQHRHAECRARRPLYATVVAESPIGRCAKSTAQSSLQPWAALLRIFTAVQIAASLRAPYGEPVPAVHFTGC
jgi:uncharacterized protein YcsI (UPF0317 family)